MNAALHDRGSPGRQRQRAGEERQHEKHHVLGRQTEDQRLALKNRNQRNGRNGQTEAGERRTERQIEAGLETVLCSRADGRNAFGHEHHQGDDHANQCVGQAGLFDLLPHGIGQDFREHDNGDKRHRQRQKRGYEHTARRRLMRMILPMSLGLSYIEKVVAMAEHLDEQEQRIKAERNDGDEDKLCRRINRPRLADREVRQHKTEHGQRAQNAQSRRGAAPLKALLMIANAADQQADADNAVQHDHDGCKNGIAGHRTVARGISQKNGHDQRHFDNRHGQRQKDRTEGLANPMGNHLGMMDCGKNRQKQKRRSEE